MSHFGTVEIDCAESAYSRGIDYVATSRQRIHFRESCGVHAGVVGVGNLRRAQLQPRHKRIDKAALANPGIARE